jgi:hypothetical protein
MKNFSLNLKITLLLVAVMTTVIFTTTSSPVYAQVTYSNYIWQSMWVTQNSNPSQNEQSTRNELVEEISRFMNWANQTNPPRPPGPFYHAQGYQNEDIYWLNTGETVLVLSESLEFLPQNLRDQVITYLKYVMITPYLSPLSYNIQSGVANPLLDRNNYRNIYSTLPAELTPPSSRSDDSPSPENLYAVWAFANYVSQFESTTSTPKAWTILNNNWSAINSLYSTAVTTQTTYWDIMAQIGYSRIAKHLSQPFATAETRANSGFTLGLNFVQFYQNTFNEKGCFGNSGPSGYVGNWDYCLFSGANLQDQNVAGGFFNGSFAAGHSGYVGQLAARRPSMFATEIGRFLHDNVQSAVLSDPGYGLIRFLSATGTWYDPTWAISKGQKRNTMRDANSPTDGSGETFSIHPSFAWQMYLLKAYVEGAGIDKSRADLMIPFTDTSWAYGDNFHIQKLVTLLRMYSTVQYSETDPRIPTPTPTATPTPTPTPPCPLGPLGDIDCNGVINIFDYNILVTNFGKTVPPNTMGDLDNNGIINIFDYNILVTNFGRHL